MVSTADTAPQVVDLQNPRSLLTLGGALGYPEWLAWSPDSRQLACITGGDRVASTNKRLKVVSIVNSGFQVQDLGKAGIVDSRPFWGNNGQCLFYARGQESQAWLEEGRQQEVRVPGQQIWCRKDAEERPVTAPKDTQADYPLSLSPDGKFLVFERLDWFDQGSLYLLDLDDGDFCPGSSRGNSKSRRFSGTSLTRLRTCKNLFENL